MSEFEDRMDLLMFATGVWDAAMADPKAVTPVLTFLRGRGVDPVTFAVMSSHDTGDIDLLRQGVIPLVMPDVATAERRLKPQVQQLGVKGAVFCSRAAGLKGTEEPQPMLVLWALDVATGTEVRWVRLINADGTLSDPVDVGDSHIIGVDWIKAVIAA